MNLNQVTVPSINVPRAVEFYKVLGLRLIVDAMPRYARFLCQEGNSTFSIHQVDQLHTEQGIYVYFECESVDECYSTLKTCGVQFDLLPTDQSWGWREARLRDPDGNHIVIYHAGEMRVDPPWKI